MMNELKQNYKENIVPSMMEKFEYKSVMQVPKVEKVIINMGVGDAVQNSKLLDKAVEELTLIAGQKPVVTRAKVDCRFPSKRGNAYRNKSNFAR